MKLTHRLRFVFDEYKELYKKQEDYCFNEYVDSFFECCYGFNITSEEYFLAIKLTEVKIKKEYFLKHKNNIRYSRYQKINEILK